jgi:hypothetical protein
MLSSATRGDLPGSEAVEKYPSSVAPRPFK